MTIKMREHIHIRGARQHNLRNIELRIPHGQLTVITGVSGSGKSSLAFDTLYAEGYRKFMDSLSTRARTLLDQLPRPDVDFIHGLSPVIAVEQREAAGGNPRSTVGTATEIADYARLLWAACGDARCPLDGGAIRQRTVDDCVQQLLAEPDGSRIHILAPWLAGKPAVLRAELPHLQQRGYQRVRIGGEVREIDDPNVIPAGRDELTLEVVIDRLVLRADQRSRIADSLELAFREGSNRALILSQAPGTDAPRLFPLSQHRCCETCATVYPPLASRSFSHDLPDGACPTCGGLGRTLQFAPELIVADPAKSVRGGAIKPWRLGSKRMIIARNGQLKQLAEQLPFDPTVPWADLDPAVRDLIMHGSGERCFQFKLRAGKAAPVSQPFGGVIADLVHTRQTTSSDSLRTRLLAFQIQQTCTDCSGQRLNAAAAHVLLGKLSFPQFMALPIAAALAFARDLQLPGGGEALDGLRQRLHFLCEVGLGYLSLDRPSPTLSGGEAQRVRLASQLGMGLVGVTYILDEPTIGLHPADTQRMLQSLTALRDAGNTVVVVEHDADIIRAADHMLEIGPGAGREGGQLLFAGTPAQAVAERTPTGRMLASPYPIDRPAPRRTPTGDWITVHGARANNLKHIDAAFPVGLLTAVTGVSGSGKSTLVHDILAAAAAFKLNRAKTIAAPHRTITGLEHCERLVVVDQEAIGRSPRSNPATYTKILDELRKLYAKTPLAKVRGYGAGRFSFNLRGGRCERCQGDGQIRLEMHFLSDVYTQCPSCLGQRYNRETLEVRYRGLNIAEVLALRVGEALDHFANHPALQRSLRTLRDVGLDYLSLGQPANTLSGGEAQRLKLALELSKGRSGHSLYILDEPTTGLHWADIQHLMNLLFQLRNNGHTLILIEHHPDVIRLADWVLDLGPSGGAAGGQLLFAGTPDDLALLTDNATGRALQPSA
jgi:excinuclease ABC subunit A